MDSSHYYIAAALISSASVLISCINMFILLKDRYVRFAITPMLLLGREKTRQLIPSYMDTLRVDRAELRPCIIISNLSNVPLTVIGIGVRMERSIFDLFPERPNPVEGEFYPSSFPQIVKGREACIFSFSAKTIETNPNGEIIIYIAETRKRKSLVIKKAFYKFVII